MTPSLQVSEEMVEAGREAAALPWAISDERFAAIYLAMKAKDHSMVDIGDLLKGAEAAIGEGAYFSALHGIRQAHAALTAITGEQS